MPAETIPGELLSLLRCPLSGQTLALADAEQIAHARELRATRHPANETLPNAATPSMSDDFTAALVRADGKALYPIRDGIPVLLTDEAIFL